MDRLYKHEDVVQLLVDVIEQAEDSTGLTIVDRPMGWESIRAYAEEVVSDIPSAEPKGVLIDADAYDKGYADGVKAVKWIPCEERLPEENKEVLMSLEWGIDIGEYRDDGWHSEWINHYDDDNVLAWMPLPDPWEGADNED